MATTSPQVTPGQLIKDMPKGIFKTLTKINPTGALQTRKQSNDTVSLYWRYSIGAKSERVLIGVYDSYAPPKTLTPTSKGYSVAAAISAAESLASEHHQNRGKGGRPALLAAKAEAEKLEAQGIEAARLKAETERVDASRHTLKNLLTQYSGHLQTLGRSAHKDARSIFNLHVFEAWPKVAALPASQVTGEQVADMMRRVVELGKGRTANKLRSYIRSAYQTALAAKSKPSIPLHFKAYGITHNPASDTFADEDANKADKRPLSHSELCDYWKAIQAMPGFTGAVLRLHLLTGGQRIEQLVKLRTADCTDTYVTIYDGKGRPGKPPRAHTVPLIPDAAAALIECKPQGEYALSISNGKSHLASSTLSKWAVEAAASIPGFATKRIRSGVETLLASARITSDIRGRLQSHGIHGVQAKHYDGHDYIDEKRHALETLLSLLNTPAAKNVIQFKAA